MKLLLQSTLSTPQDWVDHDHTAWAGLPKKPAPTGGETINDAPGWCHGLNVQGVIFQADHYHLLGIPDGLRVTMWNDDPAFNPLGMRYARVRDFLFSVPDSRLGGAINTRQSQVIFAESGIASRFTPAAQQTTVRDWALFTPPALDVMHGIGVTDGLHRDHLAARTPHGWREWTEGLDPSELDERGQIKVQRPLGRFLRASGTRTYFMHDTSRATGVHVASDEVALELTAQSPAGSISESTGSNSDELTFLFTTPTDEPDQSSWPTGNYRAQFDVAAIGADTSFGLLTLGGSFGHFGRVNASLTAEPDSIVQQQSFGISSTGLSILDTGSKTWGGSSQSDRFELLCAQQNKATMGGPQTTTIDCNADSWADGPWVAAGDVLTPGAAVGKWIAAAAVVVIGGVTMTPAAAVGSWTAAAPTVVTANLLTPSAAVGTWTAVTPTVVVGGMTVSPGAAVGIWTAASPTVVVGGVTVSPGAAVGTWTAAAPTVVTVNLLTPAAAVGTWTAVSPVVALGGVTVSPGAAVGLWVSPSPTVVIGGVTVTPAAAVAQWVAVSPTVINAIRIGRVNKATVTCRIVDSATLTCRVVDSATLTCLVVDDSATLTCLIVDSATLTCRPIVSKQV